MANQNRPVVPLMGSQLHSLKSKITGRDYDLYVLLPASYAETKRKKFPVLYAMDGQWDFKLLDATIGGLVYDKFIPEVILVGVTYSGENADYNGLRAMDYTPASAEGLAGSGDAPKFLQCMKEEIMPFVETEFRADPKQRILSGSSFAGSFTLYALFSEPELFFGYIPCCPAVPYADDFAFKHEAEYFAKRKDLPGRVSLAVGEVDRLAGPVKKFIKVLEGRKYEGLTLETMVVKDDGHASVKPEAFNRGLRFIFKG